MPNANPLVADDLIEGHTMHTEADDIIAIWQAARSAAQGAAQVPLADCAANREGDCRHAQCPQLRDGEPRKSGRHCPLDDGEGER